MPRAASCAKTFNVAAPVIPAGRITASGWGWRYAGRRLPAVSEVSFTIEPGERVLLLGASGAGKSTLLAGIAGLLGGADEGERSGVLTIDGEDPSAHRGRVGLVQQDPDAGVILSRVGDDVAFGCENLGVPAAEIPARVRAALDAVGLDVEHDRATAQLSGGQKQRLAIAGVLAMHPGVLLLDEPTANLDPEGVREVRDAVASAVSDAASTLIVIEHRTEVWVDVMTRVIVLGADGGVLADGDPARVFADVGGALAEAGVWVPGAGQAASASHARAMDAAVPHILTTLDLSISRDRRTVVQRGLNLSIAPGVTTITGPNGAGKSTLALTLAGLVPEHGGAVRAHADLVPKRRRAADDRPSTWRSRELLTRIGTVFQEPEHQFLAATVREELAVGPRALGLAPADVDAIVERLLDRLTLTALAKANPFTLSGGQKRRLSVGTVLATAPTVLVLDEPTFGQDRRGWADLVALLAEHADAGGTVIAVTHDADVRAVLGGRNIHLGASGESR